MSRGEKKRIVAPLVESVQRRLYLSVFNAGDDGSLRAAISTADSNMDASNTIDLPAGSLSLTDTSAGSLLIENSSSVANKTLIIDGAGASSTTIEPSSSVTWTTRILEIAGPNVTVELENLTLKGGLARDGGRVGGTMALGGGILIDGGNVTLSQANVSQCHVSGGVGAIGANGTADQINGANGFGGQSAEGGGIYLASGNLLLKNNSEILNNQVYGGAGSRGGEGILSGGSAAAGKMGAAGASGHAGASGGFGAKAPNGTNGLAGGPGSDGANATAQAGHGDATDGLAAGVFNSASFLINPKAATHLLFAAAPTGVVGGKTIAPPITVDIVDKFGNLVPGISAIVTLLPAAGTAIGLLRGTVAQPAVNGVATFPDISIDTAGVHLLLANSGTLSVATSPPFKVVPAAASKIRFSTQPPLATTAGKALAPFSVKLLDAFGNKATNNSSTVTLSIHTGPGGATLGGTFTAAVSDGMATFNDVILGVAGKYTLTATDGSLSVVSDTLKIKAAAAPAAIPEESV